MFFLSFVQFFWWARLVPSRGIGVLPFPQNSGLGGCRQSKGEGVENHADKKNG
jgi:hypothetical protein